MNIDVCTRSTDGVKKKIKTHYLFPFHNPVLVNNEIRTIYHFVFVLTDFIFSYGILQNIS